MVKSRQKSLKKRVNTIFLVSIGVPFALSVLLHGLFIEKLIFNNYRDTTQLTLQSMSNHINSYADSCETFFYQYLFDDNLQRFYVYVNNHKISAEDTKVYYDYFRRSVKYHSAVVKYMSSSNAFLKSISFVPADSNQDKIFLLEKYAGGVEILDVKNSSYEKLLEEAGQLSLNEMLITRDTLKPDREDQAFTLARRINQAEQAKPQGYLLLEVSTDMLQEVINKIGLEDAAGVVISYPDMKLAYASSDLIEENFKRIKDVNQARSQSRIKISNEHYSLYSLQSESGFYIDYLVPESAINRKVWSLYGLIFSVWTAAVLIAFILYTRLFRKIRKATSEIMDLTEHYQLDNDRYEPVYSQSSKIVEFDNIGVTLTAMMKRIQSYVEEEYILKLKQQAAEYKAMQTEINPHFLNNVLTSFIALNRVQEKERLETAILKLSRMFRYTCAHGYDSEIGKELRFIESYLMLEKIRFEERLDFVIYAEQAAEQVQIPKLLIQPVVENAMKHGFVEDNHMMIRVEASELIDRGREFIWITVANNGKPIQKEPAKHSQGIGLQNIRERLALVYPDSFMWFSKNSDFSTICNILIIKSRPGLQMIKELDTFNP